MNKQTLKITKINLKNIRIPYFVTGLIFLVMFIQTTIYTIVAAARGSAGAQLQISGANYFWLLIIMAAIFIPVNHYKKVINLGGKRKAFWSGGLMTYTILAAAVALFNTVFYYTFERFLIYTGYYVSLETYMQNPSVMDNHYVSVNLVELFGWSAQGPFFVFMQQFAFLFLLAAVVHTLAVIQDKWYGWVTDLIIAAILATFIPIPALRPALLWCFDMILFNSNALLQIVVCLVLGTAIYALSKPILSLKAI